MRPSSTAPISGAVEGLLDEEVLRRLLTEVGAIPGAIYGKGGKMALRQKLTGYNVAARFAPWVVLVDLDDDAECAPPFCRTWLPKPSPKMRFRVVVRAIEAWLLADAERASAFLAISPSRIPRDADAIGHPKQFMVDLAAKSRRRDVRDDMVPRPGSGRAVGPAYTSRLMEFVMSSKAGWRPLVAAKRSDSLRRCLNSLRSLAGAR